MPSLFFPIVIFHHVYQGFSLILWSRRKLPLGCHWCDIKRGTVAWLTVSSVTLISWILRCWVLCLLFLYCPPLSILILVLLHTFCQVTWCKWLKQSALGLGEGILDHVTQYMHAAREWLCMWNSTARSRPMLVATPTLAKAHLTISVVSIHVTTELLWLWLWLSVARPKTFG